MGAVEKPGVFDVTGQKTLLDLLSMAGGLKEDAGQLLFLIRAPRPEEDVSREKRDADEQTPKTFVIDLEELLVGGDLTLNLSLLQGDVMNIPVSGKIFVGGEVNKPGGFPLKGKKVTVSQAVAMAEGLKPEAAGSETKIFRYSGKGADRQILSVDVYAVQKGKSEDLYLRENDIVIVPKSGVKTFLIGLRDTLKGLVGVGVSLAAF
jgi:polysaccharide export outer membrane protein